MADDKGLRRDAAACARYAEELHEGPFINAGDSFQNMLIGTGVIYALLDVAQAIRAHREVTA